MPDGTVPEPGGWNWFMIEIEDLEAEVRRLRNAGASFRNGHRRRRQGRPDPARRPVSNPIELFMPSAARL